MGADLLSALRNKVDLIQVQNLQSIVARLRSDSMHPAQAPPIPQNASPTLPCFMNVSSDMMRSPRSPRIDSVRIPGSPSPREALARNPRTESPLRDIVRQARSPSPGADRFPNDGACPRHIVTRCSSCSAVLDPINCSPANGTSVAMPQMFGSSVIVPPTLSVAPQPGSVTAPPAWGAAATVAPHQGSVTPGASVTMPQASCVASSGATVTTPQSLVTSSAGSSVPSPHTSGMALSQPQSQLRPQPQGPHLQFPLGSRWQAIGSGTTGQTGAMQRGGRAMQLMHKNPSLPTLPEALHAPPLQLFDEDME